MTVRAASLARSSRRSPVTSSARRRGRMARETEQHTCAFWMGFASFGLSETKGAEEMARMTHAASHLPLAEVKNRMRTDPHTDRRQRWLIIYKALVQPRSA